MQCGHGPSGGDRRERARLRTPLSDLARRARTAHAAPATAVRARADSTIPESRYLPGTPRDPPHVRARAVRGINLFFINLDSSRNLVEWFYFYTIGIHLFIKLYPRGVWALAQLGRSTGRSYSPMYHVPGYPTAVVAPHMPHVFWHFFCTFLLPHLPLRCFFSHFGPLSLHFDPASTKTVGPCMA